MDAAGAVDAQNASTAPWKTAQNAVSHSAHTHSRFRSKKNKTKPVNQLYTRNSGQSPPGMPTRHLELGDLDGDGRLDIVVGGYPEFRVWGIA
jgi:hypothetical protein